MKEPGEPKKPEKLLGSTIPRIYTLPLPGRGIGEGEPGDCPCGCALTPESSRGFEVVAWAKDVLGIALNPWQRWLLIHSMELNEDGSYRFRTVLVLVARQNGKTLVKAILTLWRMYEDGARYCVGTAQDLSQAREVMNEVLVPMMVENPQLSERFSPDADDAKYRVGVHHKTLNDEYFRLDSDWVGGRAVPPHGPRYLIKALSRKAGRGLAGVTEVNIDELREQRDHLGWAAVSKTIMSISDAQIWCMSNAGDSQSVVLNHLRGVGLANSDPTMFHAEWSAPPGCALDDKEGWKWSNPSLGYTLTEAAIESARQTDPPNVFRVEVLCQFVDILNTAIDPQAWVACADPAGSAGEGTPVVCVESAVEGGQVVAVAGTLGADGRVRFDVVGVWASSTDAKVGLAELKTVLKPSVVGWFPKGPGAALSIAMRKMGAVDIKGVTVPEVCMTFADYVDNRQVMHSDDPLLNDHIRHTGTVGTASSWVFDRGPGATHAVWAAAGALHLALSRPEPRRRERRVIVAEA